MPAALSDRVPRDYQHIDQGQWSSTHIPDQGSANTHTYKGGQDICSAISCSYDLSPGPLCIQARTQGSPSALCRHNKCTSSLDLQLLGRTFPQARPKHRANKPVRFVRSQAELVHDGGGPVAKHPSDPGVPLFMAHPKPGLITSMAT